MEQHAAQQIRESLRAAYEAGREAARHFGQRAPGERDRPEPSSPQEQPGWHH